MSKEGTSVVTTTAAAMTAAQIGQVISWLYNGMAESMPNEVALTLGAMAVPIIHLIYKKLSNFFGE